MELKGNTQKLKKIGQNAYRKMRAGKIARIALIITIIGMPIIYWLTTLCFESTTRPWEYDEIGHYTIGLMGLFPWCSVGFSVWAVFRGKCYKEVGAKSVHNIKIEEKNFTYTYYPKKHEEMAATIKLDLTGAEVSYDQEFDIFTVNAINTHTNQKTEVKIPNCFDQDLREIIKSQN